MTFTPGAALTAAQLNTFLRDNMLETAPAKASRNGGYFVTTDTNTIAERRLIKASRGETGTTNSESFTTMANSGPEVTVDTGRIAIIAMTARVNINSGKAGDEGLMTFQCSGATSIEASDTYALSIGEAGGSYQRATSIHVESFLTPGTNTFTAYYRKNGTGSASFANRELWVLPF